MKDKVNDQIHLSLMLGAVCRIESFMAGIDSIEAFDSNMLLKHAVVYNLQCIGESAYKLTKEFRDQHPEIEWRSIEGSRHVLVHDYYQVETSLLWSVLQNDLDPLKQFLLRLGVKPLETLR